MKRTRITLLFILVLAASLAGCGAPGHGQRPQAPHPALLMQPVPNGLGVNIHFYTGNAQDWRMLEAAGVGIVRMDVSWKVGEPRPGQYDFSAYDSLLARLKRRDMRLLFILNYGNPNYGNGPPTTRESLEASARFASALARHFAGEPIIWELWNEPNLPHFWPPKPDVDAYVRWCKAVVPAIRAADPQACIVGPATSRVDLGFLEACFQRGYLELVDGVSVHPYRGVDRGPETVLPEYQDLRTLIAQYVPKSKTIPILSGEWGYSTARMSRELQGKYLPRQWLANLSAGIPISIWYDWHDDGQDPNDPEHNFGTVTWDYKPKPAYLAMKTLTRELKGYSVAGRLPLGSTNDFVVAFAGTTGTAKLAAWKTAESHTLDLPEGLHIVRAVDHLGHPLQVPASSLRLTDAPVYLSLASPLPEWLHLYLAGARLPLSEAMEILRRLATERISEDPADLDNALSAAFHSGDAVVRRTAWSVVVALLDRAPLDPETTLQLARKILRNNPSAVDQARLVYILARKAPLRARPLVESLPATPELERARASFRFQLAYLLARDGKDREAEKVLLEGLRGSSQRHLADRVLKALSVLDSTVSSKIPQFAAAAGFVPSWWVAGPFPRRPELRFSPEKRFDPKEIVSTEAGEARWQRIKVNNLWGIIDFGELYGKKPGIAYARTELEFGEARPGILKVGSNDGVVLFLNGETVHEKLVPRGLTVDQDVVPVRFRKGKNVLLAKVVNEGANWQLCVRVCDAKGEPLDLSAVAAH